MDKTFFDDIPVSEWHEFHLVLFNLLNNAPMLKETMSSETYAYLNSWLPKLRDLAQEAYHRENTF